ncbi:methyl-accepting chemotaxis protein [Rubellimicrobium arenae]|uniref:methyl-accepting chemotaxis protein n=1 Tax=Rubellimicrobium arenae TaxID=2817372 RepID=UPI001B31678B|nr:methyl-accepting chemotaxis protein [Rubellimicrobium arenae]
MSRIREFDNKLTIRKRLVLAFTVMAALSAGAMALSTFSLLSLNGRVSSMVENDVERVRLSEKLLLEQMRVQKLVREHILVSDAALKQQIEQDLSVSRSKSDEVVAELKLLGTDDDIADLDAFNDLRAQLRAVNDRAIALSRENKLVEASDLVVANGVEIWNRMEPALDDIVKESQGTLHDKDVASRQITYRSLAMLMVLLLVSVAFGTVSARWTIRIISKAFSDALDMAQRVARGDLTATATIERTDEAGEVMGSLNGMVLSLRTIVERVLASSSQMTSGAVQLAAAAQQLTSSATEQAAATEEVSASVEEIAANIKQTAFNASETEIVAKRSVDETRGSGQSAAEAVRAMTTIAKKTTIVQEIARQTDLLALNAAVEAARAGEHGRGFAVVASEVRKLAERARAASEEIGELSESTVEISRSAGDKLQGLVPEIEKTASLISQITHANQELATGAAQITTAIHQIDAAAQQNTATAEQVASTAGLLASQAHELRASMGFFRLHAMKDQNQGSEAAPSGTSATATAAPFTTLPSPEDVPAKPQELRPNVARPALSLGYDFVLAEGEDELDQQFRRTGASG